MLFRGGRGRTIVRAIRLFPTLNRRQKLPSRQIVHLPRAHPNGGADSIEVVEVEGLGGVVALGPA